MDLQNLQGHHGELISFMESNGYAEAYIQRFRLAISRILSEPDPKRWSSYTDIYRDYEKKSSSPNYLKQMRTVIGAIEQFDIYGRMPDALARCVQLDHIILNRRNGGAEQPVHHPGGGYG